ncbi:MAG: hypothetical protein HQM09_10560 [Candidatus Riflebacteria bacterium]|nr:hypothetical protein [Candidatus Riflebacteria bacterium]
MSRLSYVFCTLLILLTPFAGSAADETAPATACPSEACSATGDKPASAPAATGEKHTCSPDECANCPDATCPSKAGPHMTAVSAADAKAASAKDIHFGIKNIDTAALAGMIAAKTPMVLIDARSGSKDDGKRIQGAISMTDQVTAEEAAKLIPTKGALVVAYCANLKCPASLKLAMHLKKLGYTNINKYSEGIEGWVKAGNKVTGK